MEKEEKIRIAAEKQTFYNKLRSNFGIIALVLMSLIRILLHHLLNA